MKFPKVFGLPAPGGAVGESKIRALQLTDAPFLTSAGPGFIARTNNGFPEITLSPTGASTAASAATPPLWHMSLLPGDTLPESVVLATPVKGTRKSVAVVKPALTRYVSTVGLYVGAGRVLCVLGEDDPANSAYTEGNSPVLMRFSNATIGAVGGKTAWGYSDGGSAFVRSIFATGWDAATAAYRWGYSTKRGVLYDNNGDPSSLPEGLTDLNRNYLHAAFPSPISVHLGSTNPNALAHVALPGEDDSRGHYGGAVYCTGPGRLTGLVAVQDSVTYTGTGTSGDPWVNTVHRVWPFVVESGDHGATWARAPAGAVIPFVREVADQSHSNVEAPSTPNVILTSQIRPMAENSFFSYIGAGKSLFFLREAYEGGQTKCLCFRYEGGAFTRLAWGYDTSPAVVVQAYSSNLRFIHDGSGIGQNQINRTDRNTALPVSYCFGPGCCAVFAASSVFDPATGSFPTYLRFTRDFGATWAEQRIEPYDTFMFTTTAPYIDADNPGTILFVRKTGTGTDVYKTDGNFAAFTLLGAVLAVASSGSPSVTFAGGRKHVYPELPGEFNKP